ncbi:hypothetical protein RLEG12_00300 (plasmid) [Rhizobium leguminosarum bv. trifolii CB782]|nr:hypothetical protein RLEG12_00300 [Rhizobium leguminosarum bv. trifolii CB782]
MHPCEMEMRFAREARVIFYLFNDRWIHSIRLWIATE